jgi:hypothetical protein
VYSDDVFLTSVLDGGELSRSHSDRFAPGEGDYVHIRYEAGWAPEPVWTLWRINKFLAPAGNLTPDFLTVHPVSCRPADRPIVASNIKDYAKRFYGDMRGRFNK